MADCCVLKRSVLYVEGKSFDVVLTQNSLSWGHVGIDDYKQGKKIKILSDWSEKNEDLIVRIETYSIIFLFQNLLHQTFSYPLNAA